MRPQSAKAKGRRLQQKVRDAILEAWPFQLEADDVRSTSMGASGADILLSPAAKKLFPFFVECKNRETINVWTALAQAEKGASTPIQPLVVFARNGTEPYAIIRFDYLLAMRRMLDAVGAGKAPWASDG